MYKLSLIIKYNKKKNPKKQAIQILEIYPIKIVAKNSTKILADRKCAENSFLMKTIWFNKKFFFFFTETAFY